MQVIRIDEVEALVVLAGNHGVAAVDLARKQGHPLVPGRVPGQRRHAERQEIASLDQLRADGPAAIRRIGCVIHLFGRCELGEARILDTIRLRRGHREDHPFADVQLGPECQLDDLAVCNLGTADHLGN